MEHAEFLLCDLSSTPIRQLVMAISIASASVFTNLQAIVSEDIGLTKVTVNYE
jgi:hypothetical protein